MAAQVGGMSGLPAPRIARTSSGFRGASLVRLACADLTRSAPQGNNRCSITVVNHGATQAVKAAAIAILKVAGFGFLALGISTAANAIMDSSSRADTSQSPVWAIVGVVLIAFSHLVPRPDSLP